MTDEERKRLVAEYTAWSCAVVSTSLEQDLMFYLRQRENLPAIYAVLEDAYRDIGIDTREAKIPLHEDDPFFEGLDFSDGYKKKIVEQNRKRAMRIFLAIRGKILDSDERNGYFPEFVWNDEYPPSKRRELAERETKIMFWTGEWLKRYGIVEELYIWEYSKKRSQPKNEYNNPSLFSLTFEKAFLCCFKFDNSRTNHTFLSYKPCKTLCNVIE